MNNQISFLYNQDGRTNFMQLSTESNLDDVCQAFEDFLRGSGYHFEGRVEIVDDVSENANISPIKIKISNSIEEERFCRNCKYELLSPISDTCGPCEYYSNWQPQA